jgi:hypothetical protein
MHSFKFLCHPSLGCSTMPSGHGCYKTDNVIDRMSPTLVQESPSHCATDWKGHSTGQSSVCSSTSMMFESHHSLRLSGFEDVDLTDSTPPPTTAVQPESGAKPADIVPLFMGLDIVDALPLMTRTTSTSETAESIVKGESVNSEATVKDAGPVVLLGSATAGSIAQRRHREHILLDKVLARSQHARRWREYLLEQEARLEELADQTRAEYVRLQSEAIVEAYPEHIVFRTIGYQTKSVRKTADEAISPLEVCSSQQQHRLTTTAYSTLSSLESEEVMMQAPPVTMIQAVASVLKDLFLG